MSPVARAGDKFSACKHRQGLVNGPAPRDCILHMRGQHAAVPAAEGGCLWCILSTATAGQPPTSPWRWPTQGAA